MIKSFTKLAVVTSGAILSYSLIAPVPVRAAVITYDLNVSVDSGPLSGNTYSGFFSFDDSGLTGSGSEFLPVSAIEFNFLGVDYTEADDSFGPGVEFLDGNFLGLSFSTDAAFSFIPGFFEVEEASFTYNVAQGTGAGDVTYSVRNQPIPEPGFVMGILALGAFGAGSAFVRQQKQ